MTDPEADRTRRARRLLDDAVSTGRVELPTLSRDELAALGALDSGPLRDAGELAWWLDMSEEVRTAVTVAALRGLGARGLVNLDQPPSDSTDVVQVPTAPELGAILASRAQPAFVAVGGDPEAGQPGRLRLYGILEEGRGVRCVLTELVEDSALHRFALCSSHRALGDLAEWACATAATIDENGRTHPMARTLEVVRPSSTGPAETRLLVLVGTDAVAVAEVGDDDQPGEPAVISAEDLRDRLERLLPAWPGI
jgi:hypothetical protein